nr:MAG TPA: hypothetical protein [Caudoviricetes sp.]
MKNQTFLVESLVFFFFSHFVMFLKNFFTSYFPVQANFPLFFTV